MIYLKTQMYITILNVFTMQYSNRSFLWHFTDFLV